MSKRVFTNRNEIMSHLQCRCSWCSTNTCSEGHTRGGTACV